MSSITNNPIVILRWILHLTAFLKTRQAADPYKSLLSQKCKFDIHVFHSKNMLFVTHIHAMFVKASSLGPEVSVNCLDTLKHLSEVKLQFKRVKARSIISPLPSHSSGFLQSTVCAEGPVQYSPPRPGGGSSHLRMRVLVPWQLQSLHGDQDPQFPKKKFVLTLDNWHWCILLKPFLAIIFFTSYIIL